MPSLRRFPPPWSIEEGAKSLTSRSFPAHSHLALDKGFVCWSVSIPLRPPPMRIRVYKSPVLYGAGTANPVSRLAALGINATLSECQISQDNHEHHRPGNYSKHDFLPVLPKKFDHGRVIFGQRITR
jgi:hypothetical protein